MEEKDIEKYIYSIPFFIMSIGFIGMIRINYLYVVPAFVSFIFCLSNYAYINNRRRNNGNNN